MTLLFTNISVSEDSSLKINRKCVRRGWRPLGHTKGRQAEKMADDVKITQESTEEVPTATDGTGHISANKGLARLGSIEHV